MLSSTIKLLLLAMALVYVAARLPETEGDDLDVEIPESEADEMENVEMDSKSDEKKQVVPIFTSKCPFDCGKVCVVKYPFTWGNPPQTNYFYLCHKQVYYCCRKACHYYQNCVSSGKPEWVCYAETLDIICKCRSIPKPKIPFEIKGVKSRE
jgi:hypothetical protein